ncbi:MAG: type II toxin-antitoxin system VapB family antitoxin [Verrucomicrobiota bacterium]
MRTNIVLDDEIVSRAQELTGISTKKGVIDLALRELVRRRETAKLLELEGAVDWEGDLSEMRSSRDLCES